MANKQVKRYAQNSAAALIFFASFSVFATSGAKPLAVVNETLPSDATSIVAIEKIIRLDEIHAQSREAMKQGNAELAIKLLRQAAEAGHVFAMHDLALYLRSGTAIPQDYAAAAKWYRRAAEWGGWGFAGSQNNLGDMYENGHGVPKSLGDAIYWYTRAAFQGEPTAYLSLGSCFADGIGVTKNLAEGYFWLSLAAENLHDGSNRDSAMSKLQEIEKLMRPEHIETAKAKVKAYTPYVQTPYKIGDPLKPK